MGNSVSTSSAGRAALSCDARSEEFYYPCREPGDLGLSLMKIDSFHEKPLAKSGKNRTIRIFTVFSRFQDFVVSPAKLDL